MTEDILALLPAEDEPVLPSVVPHCDLLTPALTVTWAHMDTAIDTVREQLSDLVHRHVPPGQAGVFLASLLQMMCSYHQEMDSMATNQVILLSQIVPNLWGVSWGMMEGLSLLGPPNCLASWPASLVEWVTTGPAKKTELFMPTTPAKLNTPSESSKGKLPPGSSGKKSAPPKQVTNYWKDPERKKEDAESHKQEEEKRRKKSSGPAVSLDGHDEPVTTLTSKAAPSQASQPPGLPTHAPLESKKSRGKVRWASPIPFNTSNDEPLSDKRGEPEPMSWR